SPTSPAPRPERAPSPLCGTLRACDRVPARRPMHRNEQSVMKLSKDRILTTHVGSLPRSAKVAQMLLDREHGREVNDAEFEDTIRSAVRDMVRRQAEAGLDVVSDGELSKI